MTDRSADSYVLGHSEREMRRLEIQASLIDPITRRFFSAAGVSSGHRVLDVGSGVGDVAFLAKELVGDRGSVLGIERAIGAVEEARRRATQRGVDVSFIEGDAAHMEFAEPFDAVVGRYVLQFQNDPGALRKKLARYVRPGGVIVFHELDWRGAASFPTVETFRQCSSWGMAALAHSGTEFGMGAKLHQSFHSAGLGSPKMLLEALIGGGSQAAPIVAVMAGIIRTLLPAIVRAGAATEDQVDIDTLADRMQREVDAAQALLIGSHQMAGWVRL